ncbi:hypothetical protein ACQR1H_30025 [Bradyrhizobium sp. HKCCYLRH2015]|uniref:hypothetical protein n=1 Tax=Bradyrhizobium sp. HKCCYLRH2015 TaxID=3420742 RepID=UPI003EB90695
MSDETQPICGIVMPISAMDNYSASHWSDVLEILSEALEDAGFEARIVSDGSDVGVIHKRIVQNLYEDPIVVCDVSGKNPNVMFELGMRLAFDKPTIIVKDNETKYSFDTASIEHLEYPRDLRFGQIVEFKEKLAEKVRATLKASEDPGYTTFLKHFGEFKVAVLEQKEVPGQEYIIEELKNLRQAIETTRRAPISNRRIKRAPPILRPGSINACMRNLSVEEIEQARQTALQFPGVKSAEVLERSPDHFHLLIKSAKDVDLTPLKESIYSNLNSE